MNLETWKLWKQAEESGEASKAARLMDRMVRQNMPLVLSVANRFKHLFLYQLEDIQQSGSIGLVKAIRVFNPDKGSFGSFAFMHILNEIQCGINMAGSFDKVHRKTIFQKTLDRRAIGLRASGKEVTAQTMELTQKVFDRWLFVQAWPKSVSIESGCSLEASEALIHGNSSLWDATAITKDQEEDFFELDTSRRLNAVIRSLTPAQRSLLQALEKHEVLASKKGSRDSWTLVSKDVGMSLRVTKKHAQILMDTLRDEMENKVG